MSQLSQVIIAIGANLGDRAATITTAVTELNNTPGVKVTQVSPLYRSAALKPDGVDYAAPEYINGVVAAATSLEPKSLLDVLQRIEKRHGRVRQQRWGDRTLDLDIIDFAGTQYSDEQLTLPHPRAWQRAFVLAPWHDIAPRAVIADRGTVAELLRAASDEVELFVPKTEGNL